MWGIIDKLGLPNDIDQPFPVLQGGEDVPLRCFRSLPVLEISGNSSDFCCVKYLTKYPRWCKIFYKKREGTLGPGYAMHQSHRKELAVIKELVVNGNYHYGGKVRSLIEDGWFQEEHLEQCICTATRIHKVEDDEQKTAMNGKKYTILGRDTQGQPFYTCGKIILAEAGRLYFFITAHEARKEGGHV